MHSSREKERRVFCIKEFIENGEQTLSILLCFNYSWDVQGFSKVIEDISDIHKVFSKVSCLIERLFYERLIATLLRKA